MFVFVRCTVDDGGSPPPPPVNSVLGHASCCACQLVAFAAIVHVLSTRHSVRIVRASVCCEIGRRGALYSQRLLQQQQCCDHLRCSYCHGSSLSEPGGIAFESAGYDDCGDFGNKRGFPFYGTGGGSGTTTTTTPPLLYRRRRKIKSAAPILQRYTDRCRCCFRIYASGVSSNINITRVTTFL